MKAFYMAGALALMGATTAAQAAPYVEIRDVAARIIVIPEDRTDVAVRVQYPKEGLPTITQRISGNQLILDGKLKRRVSCRSGEAVEVRGIGHFSNAQLPLLTIRVPRDAHIAAGGAVYGQVGASQSLHFSHAGCGKWTVGDTGNANINIGGSGDVAAGHMQKLQVNIGGSGNVTGKSATELSANIGGNGNISMDTLSGPAEVNIGGSGNVEIAGGNAPRLKISIAGSGRVRHDGTVHDLNVSIMGSGDVNVGKVTGEVSRSVMGSGKINIGQ